MSEWRVSVDVLAGARFAVSPLLETVSALALLAGVGTVEPWNREWCDRNRPGFRSALAGDPVWEHLVTAGVRRRWIADCIAFAPVRPGSLIDELAPLDSMPDDDVRSALGQGPDSRPDELLLATSGLAGRIAELLFWVWSETVAPVWPQRRRVLEADVVSRTNAMINRGWADAVGDLRRPVRYLGDGRIRISELDGPSRELSDGQLTFYPVYGRGFVTWSLPTHFACSYPVTGQRASAGHPAPTRAALSRLLGERRAALLTRLADPRSTSQLATLLEASPASVSEHLAVLVDAGLVRRRRSGRSVLYWRSELGSRLLEQRDP